MSLPARSLRTILAALLAAALPAAAASGCASSDEKAQSSRRASVTAAASTPGPSTGTGLYEIADMREARFRREVGEDFLEKAYATRDAVRREHNLGLAMKEFHAAQDYYHAVLVQAAPRYKPVIDGEIAQVMSYMRLIMRDRASPGADAPLGIRTQVAKERAAPAPASSDRTSTQPAGASSGASSQ